MTRIEIIANHSVEENILEAFHTEGVAAYYTKFSGVFGVGSCGPRMGDAIWPEENFVLVVWCERTEIDGIERAIASVKEHFPDEGIKFFKMSDTPPQAVYLPNPAPMVNPARAAEYQQQPVSQSDPIPATAKKKPTSYGPEGENL
jgi:hypothetical protein